MDNILNSIISILDSSVEDLDKFDGENYTQILTIGTENNEKIVSGIKNVSSILNLNREKYKTIINKLILWNSKLEKLVDESDQEIKLLQKISTDGVLDVTAEEDKILRNQIQARKASLNKEIYNLINYNVSFQTSFEDLHSKIENFENDIERSKDQIKEIKLRHQMCLENQENKKSLTVLENEKQEEEQMEAPPEYIDNTDNQVGPNINEVDLIQDKPPLNVPSEDDISNVENWNKFKYQMSGGFFYEVELTYIIHAYKETMENEDNVSLEIENTEEFLQSINANYEVLSNAVHVELVGLDASFNPQIPWRISIPFSITRNANKIVIYSKDLTDDRYFELDTQELLYEEGTEGLKYAEAPLPSPNCICVVVSKPRVEKFDVNKKGLLIESKVDDRITLNVLPNSVMINIPVQLQVQPIESSLINDLKIRLKSPTINAVQTMSPIIEINSDYERKLLKPVTLQIPIPYPAGYAFSRNRIFSAAPASLQRNDRRPKTAAAYQISDEPDSYIKLVWCCDKDNVWKLKKDSVINFNKNGDSLTIEIESFKRQKIAVIRCTDDINEEKSQKIMTSIEDGLESRPVQFIFAQRVDDPNNIAIVSGPPNKIDKIQRYLWENGYNEETSTSSQEFIIRERNVFEIDFRGNIMPLNESRHKIIYNSQLSNKFEADLKERDKYAQKSKDYYQGYISINKKVNRELEKLWETSVCIPKQIQELSKSLNKDFKYKATDVITREYISFVSQQIGEDWKSLGHALRIPEESINRISNDTRMDIQDMAESCLLKWIKNTKVYSKKVAEMERAFNKISRYDLLTDLRIRKSSHK